MLPIRPQRTIAKIAMTHIVRMWNERIARETRLEPRIPRRHIPENIIRIKTVKREAGNGRATSPARYPPALPAETMA